ncbi:MAG: Na+/glucose cotransporter, partial [Bacteroidota bacterium]
DIYKKLKPFTEERNLLRIGKIATSIVVVLGIIWIPIMDKIGGGVLYQYLQSVQSYIAPPITAVFLLGIIWKRVNSKAAIVTLFAGLVMAALRILAEIYQVELTGLLLAFATINFAHMAIFMFLFSLMLCIAVSLATNPPDYAAISGLSFGTLTVEDRKRNKDSVTTIDIVLSILLIVVVVSILAYFVG